MSKNSQSTSASSFLNLDPFMDIVTNVMGALFFVVVFAALSSFGAKGKIVTPVLSESDTESVFVECRENTVFFSDVEHLQEQVTERWNEADKKGIRDWDEKVQYLRDSNIENDFYRFVPETGLTPRSGGISLTLNVVFAPKIQNLGESQIDLEKPDSRYNQALSKLDPQGKHLYFLVDSDSFEVFHAARRVATARGFRAGWNPIAVSSPLRFGSGGVVSATETY